MHPRLGCPEKRRIVRRRVLEELLRRRSSPGIIQSHNGVRFGSEYALTLLVMHSVSMPINDGIASLLHARLANGLWSDLSGGGGNFWVTATVLYALVSLGVPRERVVSTI